MDRKKLRKTGKLIFILLLLWVSVNYVLPQLRSVDFLQPLFAKVKEYNIETDALFYTGSVHSSESEMKIRMQKKYWNKGKAFEGNEANKK